MWQSERDVRSFVCGSCWGHGQHGLLHGSMYEQRTWCMISFKMSTGRSSSFSGPLAAFSFPLGAWLTGAGAADAPTALGTARWLGQASSACFCVAIVCASSGADESDGAMSSSNVNGDDALGLPGVESGEAMSLSSGWDHVMGR